MGRLDEARANLERAAAIREKVFGPDHFENGQTLNAMALIVLTQGDARAALTLFERTLALWEPAFGPLHPWVITVLDNITTCQVSLGQYADADATARRAVEAWAQIPGGAPAERARSLFTLASIDKATTRLEDAEAHFNEAITLWTASLGKNHPSVAMGLEALGALLRERGDLKRAEPLLHRALNLREAALGPDHPDTASSLYSLGLFHVAGGDFPRAEALLERAISIWERSFGPDHPTVATGVDALGQACLARGDLPRAEALLRRALDARTKTFGPGHPDTATAADNLGVVLMQLGDFDAALIWLQKALDARQAALPPNNPWIAQSFNNIAMLHFNQGTFEKAAPLFQQALDAWTLTLGPEHNLTVQTTVNLAILHGQQGDLERATPMLERAVEIQRRTLGPRHPSTGMILNNLGTLHMTSGDLDKAEPLFQQALTISTRALEPDHPQHLTTLNNIAEVWRRRGDLKRAEKAFGQIIRRLDRPGLTPRPELTRALNNLAMIHFTRGDLNRAAPLFQRAADISLTLLGPAHPQRLTTLINLALVRARAGDIPAATSLMRDVSDLGERNLEALLTRGSEAQKRAFFTTVADSFYATFALHLTSAPDDPTLAALSAEVLLRSKGRVMDAQADTYGALRRALDPQGQDLLQKLAALRARQANMAFKGPAGWDPDAFKAASDDLASQIDATERDLAERSQRFRAQTSPITLQSVQQKLEPDAALVDFLLYIPLKLTAQGQPVTPDKPRYAAYVLRPDRPLAWADLGPADPIDQRVTDLRRAIIAQEPVEELAQALHRDLLDPLTAALGDARHLLIAPDGQLNLLPFESLMNSEKRFVVENLRVTYLTTGRDLLRLEGASPPRDGALILADPDYDAPPADDASPTTGAAPRSGDSPWPRLPGTLAEAQAIHTLIPSATLLTGSQATERALKQAAGPLILHMATHGFFLKVAEGPAPLTELTRGFKKTASVTLDGQPAEAATTTPQDPLLRAGLVMAGANLTLDDPDHDGSMTASEVSALDLWGTRLVVLSACETGVGEIRNGQGVFGLRRALSLAGSRSQVMSLWQVSDSATEALMTGFYARLAQGLGTTEALQLARLDLLSRPETRHPFFWAAFIPSGDWHTVDLPKPAAVDLPQKIEPGPRGCACQTPAAPPARAPRGALGLLTLATLGIAIRRRGGAARSARTPPAAPRH